MTEKTDFLQAVECEATSRSDFIEHIQSVAPIDLGRKKLSVIGSVCEYEQDRFIETLRDQFELVAVEDDLILMWSNRENIPYYVLYDDDEFPIFFTAANKTDEIPATLGKYLKSNSSMSRMWVGKQEMERYRTQMVRDTENLLIPYFTAKRSKNSDVPAKKRPNYDRTISYWADDGLETYRHMKSQYGVLPTNIQFEDPGRFKFAITQKGVFTSMERGVEQIMDLLDQSVDRLRRIKRKIDTGGYYVESYDQILEEVSIPCSKPWAIKLEERPTVGDIENIETNVKKSNLEFQILGFKSDTRKRTFDAEFMDTEDYSKTVVRTKKDEIRIFPTEDTGIDQNIRIYNFIDDHIEPGCEAIEVA